MAEQRRRYINVRSLEDLCYLEAVVDMAPRLIGRIDMADCLTDEYRSILKSLIEVAKQHTLPPDPPTIDAEGNDVHV